MAIKGTELSLAQLSTFRIGGLPKRLIEIRSVEKMGEVLRECQALGERWLVVGKGSNSLFDDRGFDGVILLNKIEHFRQSGPLFVVGAGMSFPALGTKAARMGWSGLEFAAGIPGSVGGAVVMNAGADGSETAEVLDQVRALSADGSEVHYRCRDLEFGYRSSPFQANGEVVVEATFRLAPSPVARQRQLELVMGRAEKQPLRDKSAGCIFRNPPGHSAGALIEQCGLKGFVIGDAQVSKQHANFIINRGRATAADILALIARIKAEVKQQTGIDLHNEVRYIPY